MCTVYSIRLHVFGEPLVTQYVEEGTEYLHPPGCRHCHGCDVHDEIVRQWTQIIIM